MGPVNLVLLSTLGPCTCTGCAVVRLPGRLWGCPGFQVSALGYNQLLASSPDQSWYQVPPQAS